MGIYWATTFISISFPALDNIPPFHHCNFFQTRSFKKEKVWYLAHLTKVCSPKHNSNSFTPFTPKDDIISSFFLSWVLLLKYTDDFSMLIHWPTALAYDCKISLIIANSPCVARQKSSESSANIRFEIFGALLHIETPLMLPSNFTFANNEVNPYAHKRNMYGENGSPCGIPRVG